MSIIPLAMIKTDKTPLDGTKIMMKVDTENTRLYNNEIYTEATVYEVIDKQGKIIVKFGVNNSTEDKLRAIKSCIYKGKGNTEIKWIMERNAKIETIRINNKNASDLYFISSSN